MWPLPKISSWFGPIMTVTPSVLVQHKLVPQLYIMPTSCPNQHPNICWEILDQSNSIWSKPKFETVSNQNCHWLISHPGGGVFSVFWEQKKKGDLLGGRATGLNDCCVLRAQTTACTCSKTPKNIIHLSYVFFPCVYCSFCKFFWCLRRVLFSWPVLLFLPPRSAAYRKRSGERAS